MLPFSENMKKKTVLSSVIDTFLWFVISYGHVLKIVCPLLKPGFSYEGKTWPVQINDIVLHIDVYIVHSLNVSTPSLESICGQCHCVDMIWTDTYLSMEGITVLNVYPSKNKP